MDERDRRIAANEAIFRVLNAELEQLGGRAPSKTLVCECGSLDCSETMELAEDDYRHVRSDRTTFAVKPGHVIDDVEEVVEHGGGFEVVRKKGGAAAALLAMEDPGPL